MAFDKKSGKPYYRNDHDKSTSWDRPTEASIPRAVAGSSGSGENTDRPAKTLGVSNGPSESPLPAGAASQFFLLSYGCACERFELRTYARQVLSPSL